jgi:hypothetical protein
MGGIPEVGCIRKYFFFEKKKQKTFADFPDQSVVASV